MTDAKYKEIINKKFPSDNRDEEEQFMIKYHKKLKEYTPIGGFSRSAQSSLELNSETSFFMNNKGAVISFRHTYEPLHNESPGKLYAVNIGLLSNIAPVTELKAELEALLK